ncbi:MAG: GLPGLI family protein, partial [Bergeyella zoohelcum]|nr:GLPGLI family protein [Bergeyella zoohelcum]
MKNLITSLLVAVGTWGSAQVFSAEYLVQKDKNQQVFVLDIDKNKSLFYSDEYCAEDEESGVDNPLLVQKKNDKVLVFGDIEDLKVYFPLNINLKWNLLHEQKQIQGTSLKKAVVTYKNKEWTAWYNPEMSISEGPFVFSKLPGFIYEIETDGLKISLTSINKNIKKCVEASTKAKLTTKENYDKAIKDQMEEMKKFFGGQLDDMGNHSVQSVINDSFQRDLLK